MNFEDVYRLLPIAVSDLRAKYPFIPRSVYANEDIVQSVGLKLSKYPYISDTCTPINLAYLMVNRYMIDLSRKASNKMDAIVVSFDAKLSSSDPNSSTLLDVIGGGENVAFGLDDCDYLPSTPIEDFRFINGNCLSLQLLAKAYIANKCSVNTRQLLTYKDKPCSVAKFGFLLNSLKGWLRGTDE